MNDATLMRALGSLRTARMSEAASDRVREELEQAWRNRTAQPRARRFTMPAFAPAFAIAAAVVLVGLLTLRSGADSPLYAARIAIEDALVVLQADRSDYLAELYEEREAEAARFEAVGNALAASRARAAQAEALRLLNQDAQRGEEPSPEPSGLPEITLPSPTPEPSASPTPAPALTPTPTVTPVRPATIAPAPTRPTATRTPYGTPRPFAVEVTGVVKNPDGSLTSEACVSETIDGPCFAHVVDGKLDAWMAGYKGKTTAIIVRKVDPITGRGLYGKAYFTINGPTVNVGTITLRAL